MAAWGQGVVPRTSGWKAGLPLTDQRPGPQLAKIGVAPVGAAVGAAGDPSGMGFPGSEQSRQAAQPVLWERWDPLMVEVARPLHQGPRRVRSLGTASLRELARSGVLASGPADASLPRYDGGRP